MVRLLMQWNIKIGREQDFYEFIVRKYAPGLMQLGIEPDDVLYTIYGDRPQILAIGGAMEVEQLRQALESKIWEVLQQELLRYIKNYKQRIVRDNGRNFQV